MKSRLFATRWLSLCISVSLMIAAPAVAIGPRSGAQVDPELARQMVAAGPSGELLVFVHAGDASTARHAIESSGMRFVESFDKIGVSIGAGTPAEIGRASKANGVSYLEADLPIHYDMTTSHLATRGQSALGGFTADDGTSSGVDGSGVTIAIVDSGVDATHPMFQVGGGSKVLRNLRIACEDVLVACQGPQGQSNDSVWVQMDDTDSPSGGHGTHVSGIAAGVTATTTDGRQLHGAAPGAKLVVLATGAGLNLYGATSGLNWVLTHNAAPCGLSVPASTCPAIKVVNNSWSSGTNDYDANSTVGKLANALVTAGVTVVWAAGNSGGDGTTNKVSSYAQSPTPGVLGVANYDDAETGTRDAKLDSSSSRGLAGSPKYYPDVAAPGAHITSSCRPTMPICSGVDAAKDPNYGTISGTSMASPHIAGIVAQLVQAGRESSGLDLTPAQIEDIIEDTAYKFSAGAPYEADLSARNDDNTTSFDKGHGLVDVKRAVARIRGLHYAADTLPLPGPQSCSKGGPTMLDPSDDTFIVKFIPTNSDVPPYEPQLDITEGSLSWNAGTGTLSAAIKLVDLDSSNGPTTPVAAYNLNFYRGAHRYYIEAARDADGSAHYKFGEWTMVATQGARLNVADAAGSFDPASDTVNIQLSNAVLTAAGLTPLTSGEALTDVSFASRRAVRTETTTAGLSTDSTSDICRYVVGTGLGPVAPVIGTLSTSSPTFDWQGPATTNASDAFGCGAPSGAGCQDQKIDVTVPVGGANLGVTVTTDVAANDYDFDILDPSGAKIGGSAEFGSIDETDTKPVTVSGIYTIRVKAYLTVNASYHGAATLSTTTGGPPPPTPDGTISSGGSYSWTGNLLPQPIFYCVDPYSALCDNELVQVNVPTGGATLTVVVDAEFKDIDLISVQVYDPNGTRVGDVGFTMGTITITVEVTLSGVYRIAADSSVLPQGYSGSASLS